MPDATKSLVCLAALLLTACAAALAQDGTHVAGVVRDAATGEPLVGVNIAVRGTVLGTVSDEDGTFALDLRKEPPLALVVSLVGYGRREVTIREAVVEDLVIELDEAILRGEEVVVSASRVAEGVMRSPVAIETMDLADIRRAPAPDFYSALSALKGVALVTQSMTHKAVNVRGFGGAYNVRFVQVVDGMDNQAPGLNFPVGNIVGISELDLERIELLPGAASALYGPNALNGILLMYSKDPFEYQGLSAHLQMGVNHLSGEDTLPAPVYDFAARYARAFGDRVAFKVNVSYLTAEDWYATNYADRNPDAGTVPLTDRYAQGTRSGNPNFDGVNVYGDEVSVNMRAAAQAAGLPPPLVEALFPEGNITRTGYRERDLWDYDAQSLKLNAALHVRLTDRAELILQGDYGTGTTVYTASDRYAFADFRLWRAKAEVRGPTYFVRAYTTQERSGDSHALGTLGLLINNTWKPYPQWFADYLGAFATARGAGATYAGAHAQARAFADEGRLVPGTARFEAVKDSLIHTPLPRGAGFVDRSNLYDISAQYRFDRLIDFAEVIVGGNYRIFDLNSNGTIFADEDRALTLHEYGAYVQASRPFFENRLKLTGSLRLDKHENFDAQLSPRLSAVYTIAGTHNLRVSYQTAFRNPTAQDQYQNVRAASQIIIGGLPEFRERYDMRENPVYSRRNIQAFRDAYRAALEDGALQEAAVAEAARVLDPYSFGPFVPEHVQAVEVGYRSRLFDRLFIDAYYYYNFYHDFIGSVDLVQTQAFTDDGAPDPSGFLTGEQIIYDTPVNVQAETVTSQGWALGLGYRLPGGYALEGNVAYNHLNEPEETLNVPAYNTPAWRTNLALSNAHVFGNVGFSINWRYQSAYTSGGNFSGPVPAFSTLDAQISYTLPAWNTRVQVGGTNLLNERYITAYGNPTIGTRLYLSITYDALLN